jgi:hypothetical protein
MPARARVRGIVCCAAPTRSGSASAGIRAWPPRFHPNLRACGSELTSGCAMRLSNPRCEPTKPSPFGLNASCPRSASPDAVEPTMTETTPALPAETVGTEITRFSALRHGGLSRYTALPWGRGRIPRAPGSAGSRASASGRTEEHLVEELAGIRNAHLNCLLRRSAFAPSAPTAQHQIGVKMDDESGLPSSFSGLSPDTSRHIRRHVSPLLDRPLHRVRAAALTRA